MEKKRGRKDASSFSAFFVGCLLFMLLPGIVSEPPPPPPPAVLPNPVVQLLTLDDLVRFRTDTPLPTYVASGTLPPPPPPPVR